MAEEKGVWRTIRGRRVFIREGEDLASAMKRSGKFKDTTKQGEVPTKSTINTMTEKNSDIAEKIISDDEWNDVKVTRYGNGNAVIENERTGQKVKITPSDTKESLSRKIEDSYKAKKINETMSKRASIIEKLDNDTKDLSSYDRYNLAVSKLENNDYSSPTERQYWAGEIERYKKNNKEGNPIENMANERIKEKSNTLNNDKIMLDYMKKKNIEEIKGMSQKDFENRINKNEKYLKTATNSQKEFHYAGEELYSDDPNRFGDKMRKYNEKMNPTKSTYETLKEHILSHYTKDYGYDAESPEKALIDQVNYMKYGNRTNEQIGKEIATGGGYLIYNQDMREFLDKAGISYKKDGEFDKYTEAIGVATAQIINEYNEKQSQLQLSKAKQLASDIRETQRMHTSAKLEAMSLGKLRSLASEYNIDTKGLNKDQLLARIKSIFK